MCKRLLVLVGSAVVLVATLLWMRSPRAENGPSPAPAPAGPAAASPDVRSEPIVDTQGSIGGRVTNPSGDAVAGANVCARPLRRRAPGAARCVRSRADGHYRIDDLGRERHTVAASARGYLPESFGEVGVRLDRQATIDGIDLELTPGGVEVVGHVRDLLGGPVEGALVYVPRGGSTFGVRTSIATTDADGDFTLWTRAGPLMLVAEADGYATARELGHAPDAPFALVLAPESILSGVVRLPSGAPVADAHVEVLLEDVATVSDAQGRYRLEGLEPGRYRVQATAEGARGSALASMRLGLTETRSGVDIVVHPGAFVTATVRGGGRPCPSGTLVLHRGGSSPSTPIIDGDARFDFLSPGPYRPEVRCRGFADRADFDPLIAAIEGTAVILEVEPSPSIVGVVVDATGRGVPRVRVQAACSNGNTTGFASARADPDGAFEVVASPTGTCEVTVDPDRAPAPKPRTVEVDATSEPARMRFELAAGGQLLGRVTDPQGRGLPGLEVEVDGTDLRTQHSDREGAFRFEGLTPGPYTLAVSDPRLAAPLQLADGRDSIEVTEGQPSRVTLEVESCDATIAGQVVDEAGGPLADAFVTVARAEGSWAPGRWGGANPVVTDTDGRFEMGALPHGTYAIRAFRRGGGEGLLEGVESGTTDATVALLEVGALGGAIEGDAPTSCMVVAREHSLGLERREFPPPWSETWRVEDLPPGSYNIDLVCKEGTAEAEAEVASGQQRLDVALALRPRATIRGRVAWDDGRPAAGVVVYANKKGLITSVPMPGGEHDEELTDADGRFVVRDAPTGTILLTAAGASMEDWAAFPGAEATVYAEPGAVVDAGDLVVSTD